MYLNKNDLLGIATGPPGQGEAILKQLEAEIVSLKRTVSPMLNSDNWLLCQCSYKSFQDTVSDYGQVTSQVKTVVECSKLCILVS